MQRSRKAFHRRTSIVLEHNETRPTLLLKIWTDHTPDCTRVKRWPSRARVPASPPGRSLDAADRIHITRSTLRLERTASAAVARHPGSSLHTCVSPSLAARTVTGWHHSTVPTPLLRPGPLQTGA